MLSTHDGDDCLPWPYAKGEGYGQFARGGRIVFVHREALTLTVGGPPTASHQAAHSCRNRSCFNPRHLRWATAAENAADRDLDGSTARGSALPQAKLTAEAVRLARRLRSDGATYTSLAARFGVTPPTVRDAINGKSWAWV